MAAILLLAACASAKPAQCPAVSLSAGPSLDEARAIVAEFESTHLAKGAEHPGDPQSLDDVLDALHSDELDRFPAAVAFASRQQGPEAKALAAQIELAWGEAELTLAEVFSQAAQAMLPSFRAAEARGEHGLEARLYTNRAVADALVRLAAEHTAQGLAHAREVIAAAPDNYQGYRVAADYYRMRERWSDFDAAVAKIEQLNAQSNGLLFLRGVSALQREGDVPKASGFFRAALEKDPKFVRAQVQLMRAQPGFTTRYAEYLKLKAVNPRHQIVVWAGPSLEKAHESLAASP
jgi:tetratricopeptide (TPR) repeat protein